MYRHMFKDDTYNKATTIITNRNACKVSAVKVQHGAGGEKEGKVEHTYGQRPEKEAKLIIRKRRIEATLIN
jgi:hypothetical protein